MISILIAFVLGIAIGYLFSRERFQNGTTAKGTICVVFNETKGTTFPARLFHNLDDDDEYASVRIIDPITLVERNLPMFVRRNKLRFFLDDGATINMGNWQEIRFVVEPVANLEKPQ